MTTSGSNALSERTIERRVCAYAKKRGWWQCKLTSPGLVGVPDRLFLKKGYHVMIEFKRPGRKLTKKQEEMKEELEQFGATFLIVDNELTGKNHIDAIDLHIAKQEGIVDE